MTSVYEIEYKFQDELAEKGWRTGLVLVYETGTADGDNIQHALDCANEDDDWSGVDKLLTSMFGFMDEDIAFYFDRNGIETESLVLEIEHDFDIVINKIGKVESYGN